jgi:hypothetical protein
MSFVQNQLKKDNATEIENQSKLRSISYGSESEIYELVGSGSANNSKGDIESDYEEEDDETESYDEDENGEESNSSYEEKNTKKFKKI